MEITDEMLEYVSKLAKLELTEEEKKQEIKDMQSIVSYMDILNTLDTSQVEATSHIYPIKNVFREDIATASYNRDEILLNAPEKKDGCYKVPKTVE